MNIQCTELKFGLEGWAFAPEREDLSAEFTRLLGLAQEGGSTVAECSITAGCIDFSDDNSWYREWKRTADASCARADAALAGGNHQTATSNWLRAMNYYMAAAFPFDAADNNHQTVIAAMRRCAQDYLRYRHPNSEVVMISWPGGYPLEGYFLPGRAASSGAPAVICMSEPGQRKEEYLCKALRYASERGLSLLAVDLFGADVKTRFDEIVGRSDLETTIGYVMDYLVARDDVDSGRIAILSDASRSSFVARGIAFDDRFAAAVCDGGLWDMHERAFLRERLMGDSAGWDTDFVVSPALTRVARSIKCPVLVLAGERGWLLPDRVKLFCEALKADGRDVTLKMFTSQETAAAQGCVDNPTLVYEFIFDWIGSRLATKAH